jgi:hypothetical protein
MRVCVCVPLSITEKKKKGNEGEKEKEIVSAERTHMAHTTTKNSNPTYPSSFIGNLPLVLQITLVADEKLVDVLAGVPFDLLQPLLDIVVAHLIGDIEHDDDSMCSAVVAGEKRREKPKQKPKKQRDEWHTRKERVKKKAKRKNNHTHTHTRPQVRFVQFHFVSRSNRECSHCRGEEHTQT